MKKVLVSYFSASGVTAGVAGKIAKLIEAPLYEIKPAVPYTAADLNWRDENSRSSVEMKNKAFRPPLADCAAEVADKDVIFVGFPIWWYVAPTIINTFLESYDFSGKTVILFATSGGSPFGNTCAELLPSVAESCELMEGKLLNRASEEEIAAWIKTLNL